MDTQILNVYFKHLGYLPYIYLPVIRYTPYVSYSKEN